MVQSCSRGLMKDQLLIQATGEQLQDELGRASSTTAVVFYYKGIQMSDIFVPVSRTLGRSVLYCAAGPIFVVVGRGECRRMGNVLGWLNHLGSPGLQCLGTKNVAAEISPAAASEVGFCPVPPCCCCLVLGCRSCPSAQRAPLRCKQVAVALPLLDFDRLGGESFRALGKLPK